MGKTHITGYEILYILIGMPWLFLMLFTSRMYTEVKMALLGVLIVFSVIAIVQKRLRMNSSHKKFVAIFITYILLSLVWGILLGYQYEFIRDFSLIQYYVITPICIIIFGTILGCKKNRLTYLWNLLKYLTLLLVILDVAKLVFVFLGQDPFFLSFIMLASENYTTKLSMRVSNEPALMFLVPIYIYLFFNPDTNKKNHRIIYGIIIFFSIIYAVLSGRKMLELVIGASFFVSLIYNKGALNMKKLLSPQILILLIIVAPLFLFFLTLAFDKIAATSGIDNILQLAYETLTSGLSSGASGFDKRVNNTDALIEMWMNSPIIGNGLNSYAENSLANSTTKWSYEVVYIAWLAQTGLIGALLFLIAVVSVYKTLLKKGKMYSNNIYFALIVGFFSFIICGASNPLVYLVWPWSIILAFCYNKRVNICNV